VIGTLRHRVTFETKTQVLDEGGGFSESWSSLVTVFAAAEFEGGTERVNGGRIIEARRLRLRIRYRDDIAADLRLVFKSQVYAIDWVADPTGTRHWLDLGCTESLPS
jgi:SPP1 family predicted phage head-tail adaptor